MKIVHINGVFKSGSTGAIISSINDLLKKNNIECVVCYGIGPKRNGAFKFCYRYEQALYRRVSKLIGLRYGFAPFSTLRLINFLKKSEADIVHLHSINGNCVNIHKLLKWLKKIIYLLSSQIMLNFFIQVIALQHMDANNINLSVICVKIKFGQQIMH